LQNYAQDVAHNQRATMPQFGHLSGNTEFGDLAQALETMRLRLEDKAYVDTYVHTLTHEMKSPLAAIGGAAELLQDDLPAADRARFSRNIAQQTQALRTLIDRLLTLAQLEQTPQLSHPVALNLTALVHGRIHALEPHWHQKDLSMVFDCEVAHWLVGDAFWLGQAIDNLLENAIDFSPPGACIHTTLTATAQQLALRVQDAGVGMPDYAVDKVFDRFYSLPRPDTAQKSSGLGLCLVREVAQLHGGTITLHNNPVSGTTATLILPKKPS
jgi:two-component system sensor histidine kinase CreC